MCKKIVRLGLVVLTLFATIGPPSFSHSQNPPEIKKISQKTFHQKIDLNRASLKELTRLPGIGPSKAQAILAYRKDKPFRKVEDVLNVKGIGPKVLKRIRDHIKV